MRPVDNLCRARGDRSPVSRAPSPPFALFTGAHRLAPAIDTLRRALCERPEYASVAAGGCQVRTLLRIKRDPHGDWQPRGAYVSFQRLAAERPFGFEACTFDYSYRRNRLRVLHFPGDIRLKGLEPQLTALNNIGHPVRVLRYVPRLRATFTACLQQTDTLAVGKYAAPAETDRAAAALQAVRAAGAGDRLGARVPALLGIDRRDAGLLWQTREPGAPLALATTPANLAAVMDQSGRLHARLHRLPALGLPHTGPEAVLARTVTHADWLAFASPVDGALFARLAAVLYRTRPAVGAGEERFCHGDFRLTQILDEKGHWALVDFDAACIADPRQEIGRFLAYLDYDLPWLGGTERQAQRQEAEMAYLSGYEAAGGRLSDMQAVNWYRLCAELAVLSRRVRSDRCDGLGLAQAVVRLKRLLAELNSDRYLKEATP